MNKTRKQTGSGAERYGEGPEAQSPPLLGLLAVPVHQLIKARVRGNISHFITGVTACLYGQRSHTALPTLAQLMYRSYIEWLHSAGEKYTKNQNHSLIIMVFALRWHFQIVFTYVLFYLRNSCLILKRIFNIHKRKKVLKYSTNLVKLILMLDIFQTIWLYNTCSSFKIKCLLYLLIYIFFNIYLHMHLITEL